MSYGLNEEKAFLQSDLGYTFDLVGAQWEL
jgi:hypothetical protein